MVIPIKFKTSLRTKVITFYPIYIKDQTDGAYHQIVISEPAIKQAEKQTLQAKSKS